MKIIVLLTSILIVFLFASIGSIFTYSEVNSSWYLENKPSFTPPNLVFPIVWTILYLLIAASIYLSWTNSTKKEKKNLLILFGINLLSNGLWTIFFFTLKSPILALIDLSIILTSTIFLILYTKKINKISSLLLLPYLIWLIFAGILNAFFIT